MTCTCRAPVRSRSAPSRSRQTPPAVALVVVPEVLVGRKGSQWWMTTAGVDSHLPGIAAPGVAPPPAAPGDVTFAGGALSGAQWSTVVARTVERLNAGEMDKMVLARDLAVNARPPTPARPETGSSASRVPGPHEAGQRRRYGREASGLANSRGDQRRYIRRRRRLRGSFGCENP